MFLLRSSEFASVDSQHRNVLSSISEHGGGVSPGRVEHTLFVLAIFDYVEPVVLTEQTCLGKFVPGNGNSGRGSGLPDSFDLDAPLLAPLRGPQVVTPSLLGVHVRDAPAIAT